MKNKKLINHKKGELLKNSHFSFTEPLLNAAMINKTIDRDNSALLHNRPHHIKAMETGIIVFFMQDPGIVKNKIFIYIRM